MKDPIKIWHFDTGPEIRARHERIVARLDALGQDEVRFMQANGKLPTNWDPIITAWMAGDKLDPLETQDA